MTKSVSRTLITLCTCAVSAFAADAAAEIKPVPEVNFLEITKGLKAKLGIYIQTRAEAGRSTAPNGDEYSYSEGVTGKPDAFNVSLRRFRVGISGSYKDDLLYAFTLRNDNFGKPTGKNTAATSKAGDTNKVEVHEAWMGTKLPVFDDGSVTLRAGKMLAFYNPAAARTAAMMFAGTRASAGLLNNSASGTGVSALLEKGIVKFGVDIENNLSNTSGNETQEVREGVFTSARLEINGMGDWGNKKWVESFAGDPGHGVTVGFEVGQNRDGLSPVAAAGPLPATVMSTTTRAFGVDVLFHYDEISALLESRWQRVSNEYDSDKYGATDSEARVFLAQVGYAIKTDIKWAKVLEPAVRITGIDMNRDNASEGPSFGSGDYGASGMQYEVGLNNYFAGHTNKLSLNFTRWVGEKDATGDHATANIVRLQHQINF